MAEYALVLILTLEFKHFVADYVLQYDWMIEGKGSFRKLGGYAHAGVHAAGTAALLTVLSAGTGLALVLALAEFVVHYLLDFAKAHYSADVSSRTEPRRFWALNGLDQLFHHTTYVAVAAIVVKFS